MNLYTISDLFQEASGLEVISFKRKLHSDEVKKLVSATNSFFEETSLENRISVYGESLLQLAKKFEQIDYEGNELKSIAIQIKEIYKKQKNPPSSEMSNETSRSLTIVSDVTTQNQINSLRTPRIMTLKSLEKFSGKYISLSKGKALTKNHASIIVKDLSRYFHFSERIFTEKDEIRTDQKITEFVSKIKIKEDYHRLHQLLLIYDNLIWSNPDDGKQLKLFVNLIRNNLPEQLCGNANRKVMGFLPFTDLSRFAQVSTKCYDFFKEIMQERNGNVVNLRDWGATSVWKKTYADNILRVIKNHQLMKIDFTGIDFSGIPGIHRHTYLVNQLSSEQIKFIKFDSCEIPQSSFKILLTSSKLTHLCLSNCTGFNFQRIEKPAAAIKHLDLSNCAQLNDDNLQKFSLINSLSDLNLSGCTEVTDIGLSHIVNLTSLVSLNLLGCTKITDEGLLHLKKLSLLSTLILSGCPQITDNGLAHLNTLNLNLLDVDPTNITNAALINLKAQTLALNGIQKPKMIKPEINTTLSLKERGCTTAEMALQHIRENDLTVIDFRGIHDLTDESLKTLKDFTNIQSLDLSTCENITDLGLTYLANLSRLRSLQLFCNTAFITLKGLENLTTLGLETLELSFSGKINNRFEFLNKMTSLKSLSISGPEIENLYALSELQVSSLSLKGCPKVTSKNLPMLKSSKTGIGLMSTLESLNLSGTRVKDDAFLGVLKEFKKLTKLDLSNTEIPIKVLNSFEGLHLTDLSLGNCPKLQDQGLPRLKKLARLKSLNLESNPGWLTDKGLKEIGALLSLTRLNLSGGIKITNAGLPYLKNLINLEELDLSGCINIIDEGLQHLIHLPQLKLIGFTGCNKITNEAIQNLIRC